MKGLEFPIVGTKNKGQTETFDLSDLISRRKYFEAKIGPEIKKIRDYLKTGTFMAFFVGKKNSGKGTYSNLMAEIFGKDKIALVGVGDLVREVTADWDKYTQSEEYEKLKKSYRGFISFDEATNRLVGRNVSSLLPTELVLALLKVRMEKYKGKAVFLDGLPRDIDQVSYSLFFRDLANVRDDPDMFILIDIPMAVIDERIKYRVVCPICHTSRNTKLLVTKDIGYDKNTKKYVLHCDNPDCRRTEMVRKESDDLGIGPLQGRLIKDEEILRTTFGLHGIPKVLLRNHVAVKDANKYFDNYELTPEYILSWNENKGIVEVGEKPWTIKDDNGEESYSLLAPAVVVALVKQLADVLDL